MSLPKARRDLQYVGFNDIHTYPIDGPLAERVFAGSNTLKLPNDVAVADINSITPVVLKWLERLADMRQRACAADRTLRPEAIRFVTNDARVVKFVHVCARDIAMNCTIKDSANFPGGAQPISRLISPEAQGHAARLLLQSQQQQATTMPLREWRGQRGGVLPHPLPPPGPVGDYYRRSSP
jgi:hypothetical protein